MATKLGAGEVTRRVMMGNYTDLPPLPSQTVRVFISSTFTDMAVERNYLMKNVYTKLKDYCRNRHGLEFQVVDMRWGVREDASDDHSTTKICLEEIRNCQQISCGPNFVILLGQRYGTVTLPALVSKEFEAILAEAVGSNLSDLNDWYKKDLNAIPPVYVLQPKSSHPGMEWSEVEQNLRHILQQCVRVCLRKHTMSAADAAKYYSSVTEQEIEKGVLEASEPNNRCLLFTRTFQNIDLDHPKAWRFIDLQADKVIDQDAQTQRTELIQGRLSRSLGSKNRFHYPDIEWNNDPDGPGGLNEETHADYLEEFAEDFERSMCELIDRQVAKLDKTPTDPLYIEALEHAHTCIKKCERFVGRRDILESIEEYLLNVTNHPLVIHGGSGCGKTSVLAMAAKMVSSMLVSQKSKQTQDTSVLRFLGTSPATSTVENLLQNISKHIIQAMDLPVNLLHKIPNTYDDLKEFFINLLHILPDERHLVLILDSIDQLKEGQQAFGVEWMPTILPTGVKVIISVIDTGYTILDTLKKRGISSSSLIEVGTLSGEDSLEILKTWMTQNKRQVTKEQLDAMEKQFMSTSSHKPLYLKLVFDIISSLHSYDDITDNVKPSSIKACIDSIYKKLELKHGKLLVERAMGYLNMAKNGLSETEMEDLLSLDDDVLTDVFQFHVPPIRRLPSILWKRIQNDLQEYLVIREADNTKVMAWYHRQFIERCKWAYDPFSLSRTKKATNRNKDKQNHMLNIFVEYFRGDWANKDKPFMYNEYQVQRLGLSSPDSSALRYVPEQPTIRYLQNANNSVKDINQRKVSELGNMLIRIYEINESEDSLQECNAQLFFNVEFLCAMITLDRLTELNSMMTNLTLQVSGDEDMRGIPKREAFLMARAISSDVTLIKERPEVAVILLSNQFMPYYNLLPNVTRFIDGVDGVGRELCALVAPHQQVDTAGGHAFVKIMNHSGPVNDFVFSDNGLMFSVSEKIIGIGITGNGANVILNKRPLELPEGEHFTMVRSQLQDIEMDSSDEDINLPHNLYGHFLYLGTSSGPDVYIYDNVDGKLIGMLDVKHDVPDIHNAQLEGMELIVEDTLEDTVIAYLWYDSRHVAIYDVSERKLIHWQQMDETIVTFLTSEIDTDPSLRNVGFLKENGVIACVSLTVPDEDDDKEEGKQRPSISSQFDICLPIPGRVVAVYKQHFLEDNSLVYATDENKVHYVTGFHLKNTATNSETANESSLQKDDLTHELTLKSILSNQYDDPVRTATMTVIGKVCAVTQGGDTYGNFSQLIVCTNKQTLLVRINVPVGGDIEATVLKTMSQTYDNMILTEDKFIVGYSGNRVEGFLISSPEDGKVKLNRAFSFNAHRLPIIKIEATEDFFVTSSFDGSAKIFYSQIAIYADRHMTHFSETTGRIVNIHSGYNKALTVTEDGTSAVWSLDSGKITWEVKHVNSKLLEATLTLDECHVITVHTDGTVKLWEERLEAEDIERKEDKSVSLGYPMKRVWLITEQTNLHVFTDQGHIAVLDVTTLDIVHKAKHKIVVDDVTELPNGAHLIQNERSLFSQYSFNTKNVVCICDTRDKKWKSVLRFGDVLHKALPWHGSIIIHIGNTLLYRNAASQSVVPLLKELSPSASVNVSNSDDLLQIHDDDVFWILRHPKARPKRINLSCSGGHVALSPDGKYLFETTQKNDGIQLIRVADGVRIGQYAFLLPVTAVSFSADGTFAIAAVIDKRLYMYVVADPLESSHSQRLKGLSSRQQPLLTDLVDITEDPRFKFIKDATNFLEGSSDEEDIEHFLQGQTISSYEVTRNDRSPNLEAGRKGLTKRKSKNVKSRRSFMQKEDYLAAAVQEGVDESNRGPSLPAITRHSMVLDITHRGPRLQSSSRGRLAKVLNTEQDDRVSNASNTRPGTQKNTTRPTTHMSESSLTDTTRSRRTQIHFTNKDGKSSKNSTMH